VVQAGLCKLLQIVHQGAAAAQCRAADCVRAITGLRLSGLIDYLVSQAPCRSQSQAGSSGDWPQWSSASKLGLGLIIEGRDTLFDAHTQKAQGNLVARWLIPDGQTTEPPANARLRSEKHGTLVFSLDPNHPLRLAEMIPALARSGKEVQAVLQALEAALL